MLIDSDNEVFKGVVYILSRRFEAHFDLGLDGGRRFEGRFDMGLDGEWQWGVSQAEFSQHENTTLLGSLFSLMF